MNDFETWWYHEGSGPPLRGEDSEEHCKRMCQIAWSNGAFKEREACAKVCEEYDDEYDVHTKQTVEGIALQIRARGNT